jgi:hypothetical protein
MRDSGKAIPLDVGPGSTITAIEVRADGGDVYGVAVAGRRSHFATCPNAEEHRKPKGPSSTTPAAIPPSTVRMPVYDDDVRDLVMRQVVGAGGFQNLLLEMRRAAEWRMREGSLRRLDDAPASAAWGESVSRQRSEELAKAGGTIVAVLADAAMLDRIVRYAGQYGDGGYQGRLRSFVPGLRDLARALAPLNDGGAQRKLFEDA